MKALSPFRLTWTMKSRPLVLASIVLTIVAVVWPGQSLPMRLGTPFMAVLVVWLPYFVFRVFLSIMANRGWAGSFPYYYTVLIYYMGIGGAVLSLAFAPFQIAPLGVEESPPAITLLGAIGCIAAAIAATEVAEVHGWRT